MRERRRERKWTANARILRVRPKPAEQAVVVPVDSEYVDGGLVNVQCPPF